MPQKIRQKFSVIITNTCVSFCLQDKTWNKMPKWTVFFFKSSEVFVLITENFWRIFWRTFWQLYLTPYKTPAILTKLFKKTADFCKTWWNILVALVSLKKATFSCFPLLFCACSTIAMTHPSPPTTLDRSLWPQLL